MKRELQLRKGERLHEWIDRIVQTADLRGMSDASLRDVLREVSIKSYTRGSHEAQEILKKYPTP